MARSRDLKVRLSEAEYQLLGQQAEASGVSMAEQLRRHLASSSADGEDVRSLVSRAAALIGRALALLDAA